ncbi:MAG: ABC transporter substrate-binding protein, partial [Methanospirillum sp.]|uniref:ABC transporter substrate-binding protein n=1 Tax=Methanospirillum sp. TaxID=45200 RepID=UPI00236A311D
MRTRTVLYSGKEIICKCESLRIPKNLIVNYLITLFIICVIFSAGCVSQSPPVNIEIAPSGSTNITVTDSLDNTYSFSKPVERIIALNLDTIETLIVLGAGDRIVGVPQSILEKTNLIRYLPNAVNVGESGSPNVEKITELHPDTIIIMNTAGEKEKSKFSILNIPVLSYNCYILSELPSSVKNLGMLTGKNENASIYLNYFHQQDEMIQTRITTSGNEKRPDVYLEIGSEYIAAGKGSGGDSLLSHIKADNVASNLTTEWPKVTPEWVVKTNPSFIIKTVHTYVDEEKDFVKILSDLKSRAGFSEIDACKQNKTYVITSNFLYGPKGIIGQALLGKILYPEQFSDVHLDDQISRYEDLFSINIDEKEIV